MAFRKLEFDRIAKFNSAASSEILEFYNHCVDEEIRDEFSKPASRTIAPSSFRCLRKSWFRLRGVEPDKLQVPDRSLHFTAQTGTSCHENLQKVFKTALGRDWVDVDTYLSSSNLNYHYTVEHKDLVKKLQQRLDTTREEVESMLDLFCGTIVERCSQMDSIMIQGLGTFEARKKMERVSVNPATGKRMLIPPKIVLVFKPNSAIKNQLKARK